MTKTYSNDLRERVVLAMLKSGNCRAVGAQFGVAASSVVKWTKRFRETASVAPGQRGGHRKPVLEPHRDFILARIEETSHLTSRGLRDELGERGIKVSHDTVWRFLQSNGLSFKKKPDGN